VLFLASMGRSTGGCLLSNFLLFNIKYLRYWMAFWCRCLISVLISLLGNLSFSKSLIKCLWIAPLTPVVIVMRGLTCHPTVLSVWMSGLYFAVFIYVCVIWESITAKCECNELYDNWWGWLLVGAPSTHSMYGMSLAKHVHGVVGHIHWSSHGGIVLSCGPEFWLPTFIRVWSLVCLLDCSVCAIWWSVLICRATRNPFKCWFEHVESKFGHVFMALLGDSVQFSLGIIRLEDILWWLPIYWAYWNFRVCVIWAYVVPGFFRKWLQTLWLLWLLDVHLSTYVILKWAQLDSWFLCSLLMYVCRFRMAPVWVPIGAPLSQYGVVWVVCILGMLVGFV
jgi:hypothetical protein